MVVALSETVCYRDAMLAPVLALAMMQSASANSRALSFRPCGIPVPSERQESSNLLLSITQVDSDGVPSSISLAHKGLAFKVDEKPFIECISKWRLPISSSAYFATFTSAYSLRWELKDVERRGVHLNLNGVAK